MIQQQPRQSADTSVQNMPGKPKPTLSEITNAHRKDQAGVQEKYGEAISKEERCKVIGQAMMEKATTDPKGKEHLAPYLEHDGFPDDTNECLYIFEAERRARTPEFDITKLPPIALAGVLKRGLQQKEDKTKKSEKIETDIKEAKKSAADIVKTETYETLVSSLEGKPNIEKIRTLLTSENADKVPEAERVKLQAFSTIISLAQTPQDRQIITQKVNGLDFTKLPDPVSFIQSAIFSSTDYDTGLSKGFQDAVAKKFNITPHRPERPRNASEMQTSLREGRGTEQKTETQRVEEPPGSGNYVEKEVVVGEKSIPFTEEYPLVLSSDPRITVFPDPPGGTQHRVQGNVNGGDPVHIFVDIPPNGAIPTADINNRMNDQMQNTVFRNNGMTGVLEHFHGRGDSSLGTSAETNFASIGKNDMAQAITQTFIGGNTTLGGRFLTGSELNSMGNGLRHLTPRGDFGVFNQMDPATTISLMTAMFGSGRANIMANLNRARPFINTGGAVAPSFEALYTKMYPDDAANGYAELRKTIGEDGIALLKLDTTNEDNEDNPEDV